MFVSQRMLREPRLLVPRRQPLGGMKIDNNNSLARDLSWVLTPWNKDGNAFIVNNGTITATKTGTVDSVVGMFGKGLLFSSGRLNLTPSATLAHPITIGVVGVTTSLAATQTLFSYGSTASTSNYLRVSISTSGAVAATERNGTTYGTQTPSGAVVAEKQFVAGGIFASTTSRIAFGGGMFSGESTDSADATNGSPRLGETAQSGGGVYFVGTMFMVCFWNRAITLSEASSFMLDPYQFLIPA